MAITVEIYTARRAYEIAAEYRARGVPVILGGFHPTLAPDECLSHADAIFIGDAETLWHAGGRGRARVASCAASTGAPPGVPQAGGVKPRRDLFHGKGYLPITLMQFSRGCRFACDFCAISAFFDRRHYVRPIERGPGRDRGAGPATRLLRRRQLLFSDHEAAKELLRALIPLRIRWVSQASIDMTTDPELMDLMEASGCIGNVIGFESIDRGNLRSMKKAPNLLLGGVGSLRRTRARSCASITCRRGRRSRWATTTTRSSRSARRSTSRSRTTSASRPTTS